VKCETGEKGATRSSEFEAPNTSNPHLSRQSRTVALRMAALTALKLPLYPVPVTPS
jgi:hypothetical protein